MVTKTIQYTSHMISDVLILIFNINNYFRYVLITDTDPILYLLSGFYENEDFLNNYESN